MNSCKDHDIPKCLYCNNDMGFCMIQDWIFAFEKVISNDVMSKKYLAFQMQYLLDEKDEIYFRKAVEITCPVFLETVDKILLLK